MCLNSPSHGLALLKAGAKLLKLFGMSKLFAEKQVLYACLLYTSPSPRD